MIQSCFRNAGLAALAFCFLYLPQLSEARLGETEAECEARYGTILERVKSKTHANLGSDEYAAVFKRNEIRLEIEFKDGKAWRLIYLGKKSLNLAELLKRNNENESWGSSFDAFGRSHWIRPDGKAHAVGKYTPKTAKLELFTDDYLKARAALYQELLKNADKFREERGKKEDPLEGF